MTFIETFSGRRFDLLHPEPEAVHLPDIAHSLARTNRFIGHTAHGYSVAEHSLWVWHIIATEFPDNHRLQLHAMLHDAHEAYMGDLSAPLKMACQELLRGQDFADPLRKIAVGVYWAILAHLRIPIPSEHDDSIIKVADLRMRSTERRSPALMPHTNDANWPNEFLPYTELLDGTSGLQPALMLPESLHDDRWPAFCRLPVGVGLQDPPERVTQRHSLPLSEHDLAFLFEQNTLRLLSLVRGTP